MNCELDWIATGMLIGILLLVAGTGFCGGVLYSTWSDTKEMKNDGTR